ncbi:MAG: ribbon-helix-helix protein, CopG family [Egibacteraceae bacterium]
MGVMKRSVSLDPDVAEAVERAAAEEGVSFSAWLSDAARHRLRIRSGLCGVAEWEAEAGPLSREEIAAGEALLDRLLSGPAPAARSA